MAGMTGIIGFMPTSQGPSPHLVVALALAPVVLLDLAAPTHVFGHCGAPHYDFVLAGARCGPLLRRRGTRWWPPWAWRPWDERARSSYPAAPAPRYRPRQR